MATKAAGPMNNRIFLAALAGLSAGVGLPFTVSDVGNPPIKMQRNGTRGPRETVLNSSFAERLHDPDIFLPTPQNVVAVADEDTEYARYDSFRWQSMVLKEPFLAEPVTPDKRVIDAGREYTAAKSVSGYDSIYHQWQSADYSFQFKSTRATFQLGVEQENLPPTARLEAPPGQVIANVQDIVRKVIRHGDKLLELSQLQLKNEPYGHLATFKLDVRQREALAAAMDSDPPTAKWLAEMSIKTDGYSFVFEIGKRGVFPTDPPDTKTWFESKDKTPRSER